MGSEGASTQPAVQRTAQSRRAAASVIMRDFLIMIFYRMDGEIKVAEIKTG